MARFWSTAMTYSLSDHVRIGNIMVAVLSRTSVSPRHSRGFLSFTGSKEPILIMTSRHEQIRAYAMSGDPIELEEAMQLYPEMVDQFRAMGESGAN